MLGRQWAPLGPQRRSSASPKPRTSCSNRTESLLSGWGSDSAPDPLVALGRWLAVLVSVCPSAGARGQADDVLGSPGSREAGPGTQRPLDSKPPAHLTAPVALPGTTWRVLYSSRGRPGPRKRAALASARVRWGPPSGRREKGQLPASPRHFHFNQDRNLPESVRCCFLSFG